MQINGVKSQSRNSSDRMNRQDKTNLSHTYTEQLLDHENNMVGGIKNTSLHSHNSKKNKAFLNKKMPSLPIRSRSFDCGEGGILQSPHHMGSTPIQHQIVIKNVESDDEISSECSETHFNFNQYEMVGVTGSRSIFESKIGVGNSTKVRFSGVDEFYLISPVKTLKKKNERNKDEESYKIDDFDPEFQACCDFF